jgi:outer membrane protein assembly factor BamE
MKSTDLTHLPKPKLSWLKCLFSPKRPACFKFYFKFCQERLRPLVSAVVMLLISHALVACSSNQVSNLIQTYRVDIQQGNIVVASNLAQLKPGMTQEQVKFILGSPLLTDPFHADRWDYVYRYQAGSGAIESNRLTVHFKNGIYTHYTGDAMPENKR